MSQTTPPTITPAPTAPQRGNRTTFSGLVDAFVTWLIAAVAQFQALGTNCYNNCVDAFNSAVASAASAASALGYANNAAASATAAAVASGVGAWVSGTTYAIGDCRYSPIDFRTYRRKTAGAGTTDPSADATNWLVLSVVPYALTLLATLSPTAAANVDFLNVFSSTYNNYFVSIEGVKPATDDVFMIRCANSGSVDTGTNYANGGSSAQSVGNSGTAAASKGMSGLITVINVNDATNVKLLAITDVYNKIGGGYATETNPSGYVGGAVSGVRFYWNGGSNFSATGKIRIYGYANS